MSLPDEMTCFLVTKDAQGHSTHELARRPLSSLSPGNVLVRVRYSSLNFKDALIVTGHPGIANKFPNVPGIDAAGIVVESTDPRFPPGTPVMTTGHELGVERWGGWAEYIQCPGEWLYPLRHGLTLEESMIYGTAGFTAAQCVEALVSHGLTPDSGPVVVTGATGGVGSLAVMILAKLGFHVVAVTGKLRQVEWLKTLGATEVAGRELLAPPGNKPLLSAKYAGGIDTVGGAPLANLCKMVIHRGCVACCGLTAGDQLPLSVYPFILRGITLAGIDSVWCPDHLRDGIWDKLAGPWKPSLLQTVKRIVPLAEIQPEVDKILRGEIIGRTVVEVESME